MKVRLPRIVQDPLVAEREGLKVERFEVGDDEETFLDGPVCERLAVVDHDESTGEVFPGARFRPPEPGRVLARYDVPEDDPLSRSFHQVSAFATVLATMRMFEEPDALGRRVAWAFGTPQLLVVPRAGLRIRARYERDSKSLKFYYFPSLRPEHRDRTVYSGLSQDIVAHETTHAILDGIAPDLYHASAPQSLGLHEAVADLAALVMAFRSRELRVHVLEKTGGSIHDSRLFSSLAEEYAQGKDRFGRVGYLRSLRNDKTLDPNDDSFDEHGRRNLASRDSSHELGQVLSGALYPLMLELFKERQEEEMAASGNSAFSVSGRALAIAADRFKRTIFRALDYLPPGEVSFADYGRALLASDQASHPDDEASRDIVRREFARRHIVADARELDVETDFEHPAFLGADLETLIASDWAVRELAEEHRSLFGIPAGVPFRVRPRLDVTKTYFHEEGRVPVREAIFKVAWDQREENGPAGLPGERQVTVGTTLAVDWETRRIRALLTSDRGDRQREDRDGMLARMLDEGELRPDGATSRGGVGLEISGDLMRLRRSATLLHAAGDDDSGDAAAARTPEASAERLAPPPGVNAADFFHLVRERAPR